MKEKFKSNNNVISLKNNTTYIDTIIRSRKEYIFELGFILAI